MKLCFLPSPGAPHASRHKRKHQKKKKHNNYFLPFSGSKQSLPGAFCYQNLCWKTKLNTEFKLKVQNPNLKTDPLIWVWNSLFSFWGKSLFFTREIMKTPKVHEVSPSQRTRTTLEIKFLRRWKKSWTFEGKQHKILPGFVREKEAKEYSCSCRSGKKKLYLYIYIFIYYVYITKDRTTLRFSALTRGGKKSNFLLRHHRSKERGKRIEGQQWNEELRKDGSSWVPLDPAQPRNPSQQAARTGKSRDGSCSMGWELSMC